MWADEKYNTQKNSVFFTTQTNPGIFINPKHPFGRKFQTQINPLHPPSLKHFSGAPGLLVNLSKCRRGYNSQPNQGNWIASVYKKIENAVSCKIKEMDDKELSNDKNNFI